MNNQTHNQIKQELVTRAFIDQLYSIIDTRLQYIEFHTQAIFKACSGKLASSHTIQHSPLGSILDHIEQYSKIKKQLLFLRSLIKRENARSIYDLLQEDRFKNYNEKETKQLISEG